MANETNTEELAPPTREESIAALRQQGYQDAQSVAHPEQSVDDPVMLAELQSQHPELNENEIRIEYIAGVAQYGWEQRNAAVEGQYSDSEEFDVTQPRDLGLSREVGPNAVPLEIREHAGYAVEAFDAFMGGKSIPEVALHYKYEPGQAEIFLRNIVQEYGADQLAGLVPGDILVTLAREPYGFVDRVSNRRATHQSVAEIASELRDYASEQAPLPYINAEAAIAESFRQQLLNGAKTIDLSQRYGTDDQTLAQQRHEKALENLRPLIEQTAALDGYAVQRGTAIAEGLVQREVPAIAQRHGQSMGA